MAFPSLFPDVNSTNPAVIGLRKVGVVRFKYKTRTIRREQDLDQINGKKTSASQDDNINLWKYNLMGGENHRHFNAEWMLDYTLGKQSSDIESENQKLDYDVNTWSYLTRYAFGTHNGWGAEVRYVRHRSNFSFESKDTAEAISDTVNWDSTIPGIKLGTQLGKGKRAFGFTIELNNLESTVDSRLGKKTKTTLVTILGASAGLKGEYGHFEIGLDIDPFSDRKKGPFEEGTGPIPARFTLVAEKRIWKFMFGYNAILYNGRFIEPETVVLTQLVHRNNFSGTRLQHVFKFSYGGFPKGLSLGASIYLVYSDAKEKSNVFLGDEEHDTKTLGRGYGLSLSYSF